jgi:hypothetical protein
MLLFYSTCTSLDEERTIETEGAVSRQLTTYSIGKRTILTMAASSNRSWMSSSSVGSRDRDDEDDCCSMDSSGNGLNTSSVNSSFTRKSSRDRYNHYRRDPPTKVKPWMRDLSVTSSKGAVSRVGRFSARGGGFAVSEGREQQHQQHHTTSMPSSGSVSSASSYHSKNSGVMPTNKPLPQEIGSSFSSHQIHEQKEEVRQEEEQPGTEKAEQDESPEQSQEVACATTAATDPRPRGEETVAKSGDDADTADTEAETAIENQESDSPETEIATENAEPVEEKIKSEEIDSAAADESKNTEHEKVAENEKDAKREDATLTEEAEVPTEEPASDQKLSEVEVPTDPKEGKICTNEDAEGQRIEAIKEIKDEESSQEIKLQNANNAATSEQGTIHTDETQIASVVPVVAPSDEAIEKESDSTPPDKEMANDTIPAPLVENSAGEEIPTTSIDDDSQLSHHPQESNACVKQEEEENAPNKGSQPTTMEVYDELPTYQPSTYNPMASVAPKKNNAPVPVSAYSTLDKPTPMVATHGALLNDAIEEASEEETSFDEAEEARAEKDSDFGPDDDNNVGLDEFLDAREEAIVEEEEIQLEDLVPPHVTDLEQQMDLSIDNACQPDLAAAAFAEEDTPVVARKKTDSGGSLQSSKADEKEEADENDEDAEFYEMVRLFLFGQPRKPCENHADAFAFTSLECSGPDAFH